LKSVEKQQLEIKYTQLGKQTNTEHGEDNVQMKTHAYVVCIQISGSNLVEGIRYG